jgi:cytoskeleton protein RodZ
MTEDNSQIDPQNPGAALVSNTETAGNMLRVAREAAGLHVAALAVAMKVPVKKLEALEADRLDLLPDAVFVRALASSVCRNLKIDATPVLARLPQHDVPRLGDSQNSINTPFHRSGEGRAWVLPSSVKQPALVMAMLLVLAALALWTLPEWYSFSKEQSEALVDEGVQATSTVPVEPFVVPATDSLAGRPVEVAMPMSAASDVVVAEPPTAAVIPVVNDAAPKLAGDIVLMLTARGSSWVEVTDSKGQILVRRNLSSGESVTPVGQLPLSVVVGRADVTDVVVRGKPLDLVGTARDNVARFEVK